MKYINSYKNYIKEELNISNTEFDKIYSVLNTMRMATYALMIMRWMYASSNTPKIESPIVNEELTLKLQKITKDDSFYIYEMDIETPNAFVTIKRKSLFYTKKLKEILNERELIAVMLHEYNHYNKNHIVKNFAILGSSFFASVLIDKAIVEKLNGDNMSGYTGAANALAYFYTSAAISNLPVYFTGRYFEYSSDSYSAKMGYGKELISALNKVYSYNPPKIDSGWDKIMEFLFTIESIFQKIFLLNVDVHPNLDDRIKNIIKTPEYQKAQEESIKKLKTKNI